jgi:hypothetical protein
LEETTVFCSEARRLKGKPSPDTLYNWRSEGIECRTSGVRVTLEWCLLGGRPVTSIEAYERFLKRINGELPPPDEEGERSDG